VGEPQQVVVVADSSIDARALDIGKPPDEQRSMLRAAATKARAMPV
jgi:hypothetical protein